MGELVSVVLPTYKRPKKLKRAIKSVKDQTYLHWELLIIDDNDYNSKSKKATKKVVKKYQSDSRISYFEHKESKGGSAARNTGIKHSQGDYIAFLDDDDEWEERKLKITMKKFTNLDKKYGVCFSSYNVMGKKKIKKESQPKSEGYIYKKELIKDHVSPTSAVVVRKECFNRVGYFDENLPARQDYDMWIRISKKFKFAFINKPLVNIYRENKNSISYGYEKNITGTNIILRKIEPDLKKFDSKYQKKVYASHYTYMGKKCYKFGNPKLAINYFLKSLKYRIKIRTLCYLIFSIIFSLLNSSKIHISSIFIFK